MAASNTTAAMTASNLNTDADVLAQPHHSNTHATPNPEEDAPAADRPKSTIAPETTSVPTSKPSVMASAITIHPGYRPAILGRTLEMHMDYYYPTVGWGSGFEAGLGMGMGDLVKRLDKPVNQVWSAVLSTPPQDPSAPPTERIVGVVYVDGEIHKEEGVARLRCLIVDESARGLGVGKKLMAAAMQFIKETGFSECRLSTMRSLAAARGMYEGAGFELVDEDWVQHGETRYMEMRYVWRRPQDAEHK